MSTLIGIFKKYIKDTPEKSLVKELTVFVCNLTNVVKEAGSFPTNKIYITTKALKHMYDSKPAEEFDFVLKHLPEMIKYPENIYLDKKGKRGRICFTKVIKGNLYFCPIEVTKDVNPIDKEIGVNYIVSAFRLRKEGYLNSYKLLWSWKGDAPSS